LRQGTIWYKSTFTFTYTFHSQTVIYAPDRGYTLPIAAAR